MRTSPGRHGGSPMTVSAVLTQRLMALRPKMSTADRPSPTVRRLDFDAARRATEPVPTEDEAMADGLPNLVDEPLEQEPGIDPRFLAQIFPELSMVLSDAVVPKEPPTPIGPQANASTLPAAALEKSTSEFKQNFSQLCKEVSRQQAAQSAKTNGPSRKAPRQARFILSKNSGLWFRAVSKSAEVRVILHGHRAPENFRAPDNGGCAIYRPRPHGGTGP